MNLRLLATLSFLCLNVSAQHYAPTPPPTIYNDAKPKIPAEPSTPPTAQAATQYSIGDPTDEEQLHLELINRARADANAEALRLIALALIDPDVAIGFNNDFWTVDTNLMKQQFSTYAPAPPVSMNANLTTAARGHSQYMLDNAIQDHTGAGGSTPATRVQAAGYQLSALGENVYLNAESVQDGHAAFDVDWGFGTGGMQTPPGHRDTIHNAAFVEVGIGVIKGSTTNQSTGKVGGPQSVTEDFAAPAAGTRFITGVAYYDINGNNFYDLGEGLPGVRVTVDKVSTFAITTTSGGYSIPVPANTNHAVRFNAPGYGESLSIVFSTPNNIKVDFKPTYVPPIAYGPSTPWTGTDNVYNITPLPGATGYRARVTQVVPVPPEGAEAALDRLTITTFGGYPVISTTRKASGAKSFHLGHMVDNGSLDPQIVEFNDRIDVSADARVDFQSLLARAADAQIARFEVSDDNGLTWTRLWSQAGNGSEETQFTAKSVSLAQYAGKTIRVRFNFDFIGGNAVVLPAPGTANFDRTGWFFDDITFVNARTRLTSVESNILSTPLFTFAPSATGAYLLEFQPIVGARTFQYGPAKEVTAANPPVILLSNIVTSTATTIKIQFSVTSGAAQSFFVEFANTVNGPWSVQTGWTLASSDGVYTVTIPRNGGNRFYRVGVLSN